MAFRAVQAWTIGGVSHRIRKELPDHMFGELNSSYIKLQREELKISTDFKYIGGFLGASEDAKLYIRTNEQFD